MKMSPEQFIYSHTHTHTQRHRHLFYLIFLTRETSHFPAMKVCMHSFNCFNLAHLLSPGWPELFASETQDKIEKKKTKAIIPAKQCVISLVLTSQI